MSFLPVFDFFKEAFNVNRANKSLYRPQLALIVIKLLTITVTGIGLYTWMGGPVFRGWVHFGVGREELLPALLSASGIILGLAVLFFLVAALFEAGLFNMYKSAVTLGGVRAGDFGQGVKKYFLRFLLGEILIGAVLLLLLPLRALIGIATLSVGFALVSLVVGVLLMMWKVSLVCNEIGVLAAIGDSFRFARDNFWMLLFFHLIHNAFVSSGHGGPDFSYSFQLQGGDLGGIADHFSFDTGLETIRLFQYALAVLVPLIVIMTAVILLVKMIFDVFFSLAMFVTYIRKSGIREGQVSPDVV